MKAAANSAAAPDAIRLGEVTLSVSDYASQGNAILGIRDSGKTYTATWLAEQLDAAGVPFIAFDPIGVWRYLRHAPKGQGVPVVVAGGEHGDIPLSPSNVEGIVRHAMKANVSLVIDLYSMAMSKADWRRIVQAAVKLLLYENKQHGRRHVFIEEAAEFAPQMMDREHGAVYAEIEKLARMGGNAMLGLTLINQRAEQLNKAVLELCDCLFLHRQKGSRSIQALNKWLSFSGGDSKRIARQLPTLEQGECFVWAGGSDVPLLVTIPKKRTLHPNRREVIDEGTACDVSDLIAGFPKAEDDDEHDDDIPMVEMHARAERFYVFSAGEVMKLEAAQRSMMTAKTDLETMLANLGRYLGEVNLAISRCSEIAVGGTVEHFDLSHSGRQTAVSCPAPKSYPLGPKHNAAATTGDLGKGPRKILSALASHHPRRLTQGTLCALTGFTPSTLRTYLPKLHERDYLDNNGHDYTITAAGVDFIGADIEPLPKTPALRLAFWKTKFGCGEANVLQHIADHRNRGVTIEELASLSPYTPSTLRTYLPRLVNASIIHQENGRYYAAEEICG